MDNILILRERVEQALNGKPGSMHEIPSEIEELISDLWSEIDSKKSPQQKVVPAYECGENDCLLSEAFYATLNIIGLNYHQNINAIASLLGQYCNADFVTYSKLKDGQLVNIGKWAFLSQELDSFEPTGEICYKLVLEKFKEAKAFENLDNSLEYPANKNPKIFKIKTIIGMAVFSKDNATGAVCMYFKDNVQINQTIRILLKLFTSLIALEELRTLPLSETEEKLSILMNASPDFIGFKDGQNRWLQANNTMLDVFGLQNIDYTLKSNAELSQLTHSFLSATFKKCTQTDDLAWETGSLSRTEESIPDLKGVDHIYDVIKVPLYNEDKSRKGLVVSGREITGRIIAQQHAAFLNQSALGFLEMDDTDDIYEYIASSIFNLLDEQGIVMVASFDESVQVATLRSYTGLGPLLGKVLKLINRNPIGMTTYLDEERKKDVLDQSFITRKNLYEMLNGALSAPICKALEHLLNIGKIYEMGFASKNWLLGDVTILLPKGAELPNRSAIETFMKLSAVALYQRQVKLRLVESEESYRGLFNSMSSAVYIMDEEAKFLDVNQGALNMYGYSRERFIGQTPDFLSAPGRNKHINLFEVIEKTFKGEAQHFEYWGIKKDGTIFPKDIKFYKGFYLGKSVILIVADDITERYSMVSQIIEARDEAEQNMQKTQSIVMAFPDLIMVIDEEGNLIEALSGTAEYAAYTASKNQHLTDFLSEYIWKQVFGNIHKVISTGEMKIFTIENLNEERTSSYEVRMVKYNSTQVLAVIRDVTQRVELIHELNEAKDKAEESGRLKTAFLHNISHEIRTPLNGIVGFSNLLTQPGVTLADTSEYVSYINSCSDQLLSIINDIVNVATLEAGQEKIQESEVNLNKMIRHLFSQFESKVHDKGLELSFSVALPDDDCLIITDETKLLQIFSNLIGNSVKFTNSGSVRYGYVVDGSFIEFFVQDTGVGIQEDMHEVIFDRFHQVNNTLSMNTGGTGLGLSISKSYAELMGGRIWLKSIPGEPTTFFFTIPFKTTKGGNSLSAGSSVTKSKQTLRNRVILVADDEEVNYRLIKGILAGTGAKLIHVYNGAEAVEKCRSEEVIDLVLMDLKMNVMDGFDAASLIKQLRPELPIIAQSALAMVGDRQRALDAGCNDYISKPLRKMKLIALIEKYLMPGLTNI